jgi:hypothetical protein
MRAAKREGIQQVSFALVAPHWLDPAGMGLFANLLKLSVTYQPKELGRTGMYLESKPVLAGAPRPCATLPDGSGLYVWRGDPGAKNPRTAKNLYCPRAVRAD